MPEYTVKSGELNRRIFEENPSKAIESVLKNWSGNLGQIIEVADAYGEHYFFSETFIQSEFDGTIEKSVSATKIFIE
jgi:hypothetical protein